MAPRSRWLLSGLAIGGLLAFWLFQRAPSPPRDRIAIQAYGPYADGTALLVSDLMQLQNRRVVLPQGAASTEQVPRLLLQLSRQGGDLAVDANLDGRALPRQQGPPAVALAGLAKALGLDPPKADLMPADPADSWELLDLAGRSQDEASAALVARAQALVAREPGCISARLALGTLLTRYLVEHAEADTLEAQLACERNFMDGLAARPGYPRLAALFAIHLSDVGRQREALKLLQDALHRHPGNAALLNALAYTARTSGLLDLADRALARRADAMGVPRGQANLADNTLLYTGQYRAFEDSLAMIPPGPMRSFYRGYARLLAGDRGGARPFFAEAEPDGLGSSLFTRLSEVYRLALDGRTAEANTALDKLEGERVWMHLPDGEFTFKLAEAYGFLGRPGEALDVAERASVQGFGCATWYERAPLLAGARQLPPWISLDSHLRARQKLLEEAYPPSAFHL
ncbi:MAG TPA: hypothetical protein VNV60_06770 [Holophagaceae bacterium]|jgi:hypothetical protein|nr:hypothetical protein [Holophagaceae bacterium]